jgi:beta-phosphoglucomutase-like phosphatase (HAD superfamily)
MLLQAASDLGLDPVRCAILGDKMSDMEAGAAAGIGLRVLIGPRDAKTGEPPMKWSPILAKRSHSFDLALRRLRLISAPGTDPRRFKARAAVRWSRRAAVCPRLTVLRAV